MALIGRPNLDIIWAEGGNITEPSTEKQELGWVTEKPPNEVMNWIHNKQDSYAAYFLQEGIPEWEIEEEYSNQSYIKYNKTIYKALLENKGKQPDISSDVWQIAFSDYSVTVDLERLKKEDNYADKLVYKDAPVLRATAKGTAYLANTGAVADSGYGFNTKPTDGLFHNGSPVILKDGVEVARFEEVENRDEDNSKVVTMAVLQRYLQLYKVGDLYLTTNNGNPKDILGYGTWARYAKGKAIVGFSDDTSSATPDWVKQGGSEYGDYSVALSGNNVPPHKHYSVKIDGSVGDLNLVNNVFTSRHRDQLDYNGYISGGAPSSVVPDTGLTSNPIGDNGLPTTSVTPHNNVQPSIVVYVWRRVS